MKKLLKFAFVGIILVVGLMFIIPICFKDKVLNLVTDVASDYVKSKVIIKDLDLSLFRSFPHLNVRIKDVSLEGVEEFQGDTLVKFDNLEAEVNLRSLIGQKIKIRKVFLDNPCIYIKVLENGKANYDIAISDSVQVEQEEPVDTVAAKFAIAFKKVAINNLKLTYDDRMGNILANVDSLNFNLKGDLTQSQSVLDMILDIAKINLKYEGVNMMRDVHANFVSKVDANLDSMKFTLNENQLSINEILLNFDGFVALPDTNVVMDIKFGAKDTEFKSILSMIPKIYLNDFQGLKTSGSFNFDGFVKGTYNSESIPAFKVDLNVKDGYFQYPELPCAVKNINIAANVENPGDIDVNSVGVSKLHVELADNPVDATIFVKTSKYDLDLSADVKGKIDLQTIEKIVPLDDDMKMRGLVIADIDVAGKLSSLVKQQYEKFKAEGNIEVRDFNMPLEDLPNVDIQVAKLSLSPQKANLSQLDMNLGKSDFHLNGKIDNILQYLFADSTLCASFNFTSKLIDANDILSYDKSSQNTNSSQEESSSASSDDTAIEITSNINFALDAKIDEILYDSLQIKNLKGKIALQDSKAMLNNLNLNMLDGSAFVNGYYDAKDAKNPKVDLQLDLSKIGIQKSVKTFNTVKELAPIAEHCFGDVTAKVNFNSILDAELSPVLKTVNAEGRLITNQVAIRESKLFNLLGTATKNDYLKTPILKNLNIGFEIVDGVVKIDTTDFKLNGQDANFSGTMSLEKDIDFLVGLNVDGTAANALLGKAVGQDKSGNIKVFANIGGKVDDPKIVGIKTSATDVIKEVVKEKVEQVKQQLSEAALKYIAETKAKADKLIADATKTKEKLVAEATTAANKAKAEAKAAQEKALAEAQKQADALVAKANNPILKKTAEESAKKLMANAKKESDAKLEQANRAADNIIKEAEKKGDAAINTAKTQSDKMVKEAEEKAKNM